MRNRKIAGIAALVLVTFAGFENCAKGFKGNIFYSESSHSNADSVPVAGTAPVGVTTTWSMTFSPTQGPAGTLISVNITGADISTLSAASIGGVDAIIVSSTPTSAVLQVVAGSASGAVSLTNALGTMSSSSNFTVVP